MSRKSKKRRNIKASVAASATASTNTADNTASEHLPNPPRVLILATVALLALTFLIYFPTLQYGFLRMDDELYVYGNDHVKSGLSLQNLSWALTHQAVGNWHPLTMFSLILDCEVSGCSPAWFHLVNIFFHLAGVFFLVLAGWRLTTRTWPSLFVGAIFALHPTHVESVAWISERKDVLSGFFLAVLLWLYAGYCKTKKRKYYWGALVAFVLGLLSKPMLVSVPILLLLLDYWPLNRMGVVGGEVQWPKFWQLVKEKSHFLLISVLFCAATLITQRLVGAMGSLETVPVVARLSNVLISYLTYVCKFLMPIGLTGLYPFPEDLPPSWQPLSSLLVLLTLTFLILRCSKSLPFLSVGWLWFGISMVPVIGFVQVGPQALADRYTYIPYIGLSIMVAFGAPLLARYLWPRRQALLLGGLAVAAVAAMAYGTARYLPHWRNDTAFWARTVEVQPEYARGYYNLALAVTAAGDAEGGMEWYRKTLSVEPFSRDANYNLGTLLLAAGRLEEAIKHFKAELAMNPSYAPAYNNLGTALARLGRRKEAMKAYQSALETDPKRLDSLSNWAEALIEEGDFEGAKEKFEQILKLNPKSRTAFVGLASLAEKRGDFNEVAEQMRRALEFYPNDTDLINRLGAAHSGRNEHKAAAKMFRRALKINPKFTLARYNLAVTLKALGQREEAKREYLAIIKANPKHYWAHNDLGVLLGDEGDKEGERRHLLQAIEIDPEGVAAKHNLKIAETPNK